MTSPYSRTPSPAPVVVSRVTIEFYDDDAVELEFTESTLHPSGALTITNVPENWSYTYAPNTWLKLSVTTITKE